MINRTSAVRRQHSAALADAGPDMHDHAVGARVMTCDGHPGTVHAVNTGPYPGTETYAVTLDGGMGGGDYDGGQIWALPAARTAGTAAADYPELAQILAERPDPARHTAARRSPVGFVGWSGLLCPNCDGFSRPDSEPSHPVFPEDFDENNTHPHGDHCYSCDAQIASGRRHSPAECDIEGCTGAAPTSAGTQAVDRVDRPCQGCTLPMSADAVHHGCLLCGKNDHHSYCCPSPEGRTAARRTAGRVCDSCADRTPGAAMTDCPFCGTTHHNRASCCPLNCADCGARLSAHTGACAHCGYGDHHSECCTMACSSCEGPLRDGGKATCGGCDTERAGHHPGCCPIQKPMGYRDGDEDLCPSCAHATGTIDHPLYRDVDTYCDHCAAPMSLPRRRYTTAGITEVMASAEMSLGETIVPSMSHLPGPTRPRSPFDNPASTGWATGPDPDQWSAAPLYPLDSRVGSSCVGAMDPDARMAARADDPALFEATLHEEPEAALPTTDGTVNADDADPEALNPMEFNAFLVDFQERATHLSTTGSAGDGDLAAAAAAFLTGASEPGGLRKAAMRDFTPAEQRMLIEEAPGARAGNADRLDLTGTHYADMAAMVGGDEEDDSTWLM